MYAELVAAMIALVLFYACASIVAFGAELNAVIAEHG